MPLDSPQAASENGLATRLVDALEQRRHDLAEQGTQATWPPPPAPGWAHLPIIVVDLVFNLSRVYERVARPAIDGYAALAAAKLDWVGSPETLQAPHRHICAPDHRPHTLDEAVDLLEPRGTAGRQEVLACGRLPAWWSTSAPLRADTVLAPMYSLRDLGITTTEQLAEAWEHRRGEVHGAVTDAPGLGKAAFAYLPLLFDRDSVKLDVHVWRFVNSVLGDGLQESQIRGAFTEAAARIQDQTGLLCTMRGLEHFVWRTESGRPPLSIGQVGVK